MKKKGNFLNPLVYKFAKYKIEKIFFKNKPFYNIRNSSCVKNLIKSTFNIHNGRDFIKNDIQYMKEVYKKQPFKTFKLGQYSYNRRPINRNRRSEIYLIFKDLKRKKGIDVKFKKKKKRFFTILKKKK